VHKQNKLKKVVKKLKKIAVLTLASLLLLSTHLLVTSTRSDIIVPYEWIVPGAYAKYTGGSYQLFYPNHTWVTFFGDQTGDLEAFLEWTVLDRVGDSVLLNLTFFVNGTATMGFTESVPDGKVNILDIATVAKVFGKQVYQWGYDYNADVIDDGKVDIIDIATVAKAYGTNQDSPKYNHDADVAPENETLFQEKRWVHYKNLLLDIDVYSRETFLGDKPLGKTCFWAEPYANINDTLVLYGSPPDEIIATVDTIKDMTSWDLPGVTGYRVEAFQLDPYIACFPYFDWDTGMAITVEIQGSQPVSPDSQISVTFKNDTTYNITRFASTPLGTELNIGSFIFPFEVYLTSTNVQLGPP
jgi:hypothetical protein